MEHPTNLAIFSLKKNPRSNSSRVLFQPMPENGGKWYRRWPGQMMAWLFWPNYDISPTCFFLEIRGFPFLSYLLGERGRVRLRWNLTRLNEPTLKNKTSTWSKTKQQNKHKNLLLAWWGYFLWKSWEFRPQHIDPPHLRHEERHPANSDQVVLRFCYGSRSPPQAENPIVIRQALWKENMHTLPETNIATENRTLEKQIPIGNHSFLYRCYVS